MRNLLFGVVVALLVCTGLLVAQAGMDITITVSGEYVYVVRQIIAKRQNVDPATVTDTQVRNGIVATCRDAVQGQVRNWRREQDKPAIDVLLNDLTEAERVQVRAYILSFVK